MHQLYLFPTNMCKPSLLDTGTANQRVGHWHGQPTANGHHTHQPVSPFHGGGMAFVLDIPLQNANTHIWLLSLHIHRKGNCCARRFAKLGCLLSISFAADAGVCGGLFEYVVGKTTGGQTAKPQGMGGGMLPAIEAGRSRATPHMLRLWDSRKAARGGDMWIVCKGWARRGGAPPVG